MDNGFLAAELAWEFDTGMEDDWYVREAERMEAFDDYGEDD